MGKDQPAVSTFPADRLKCSLTSRTGSRRWTAQSAPLRNRRSSSLTAWHAFWLPTGSRLPRRRSQAHSSLPFRIAKRGLPCRGRSPANPPLRKFRFPSLLIASANDPYGTIEYVRERASQWGSRIVEVGHSATSTRQAGLGTGRRERRCSRLSPPELELISIRSCITVTVHSGSREKPRAVEIFQAGAPRQTRIR